MPSTSNYLHRLMSDKGNFSHLNNYVNEHMEAGILIASNTVSGHAIVTGVVAYDTINDSSNSNSSTG